MRIKLAVYGVISVLCAGYLIWQYGGGRYVFPGATYPATVRMARGGGIFDNAEVTYRGVNVGQVSGMHLARDGVELKLRIDASAQPIPADVRARAGPVRGR